MKLSFNEKQHAYWLDGKRCKGVTSVADIGEDGYGLQKWAKRVVAIGMAKRADLVQRAAAHHLERDKLDEICEEALKAGGGADGREYGTAVHRITEDCDLDNPVIPTVWSEPVMDQWERVLERHGVEILPDYIERVVVWPDRRVCGTFDRIVHHEGRLRILDIKTGENAHKYPHKHAKQLALYAHAPLLAGPLDGRGVTERFEPLPDVDKRTGLIIHMPEGGPATCWELDIAAGAETLPWVWDAIEWRARRDLIKPAVLGTVDDTESFRLELLDRVHWLTPATQQVLRDSWPFPGRSLTRDGWTADELDQVAGMIRVVRGFPQAETRTS